MAFNENKPLTNSPLNSTEVRDNFQHLKKAIAKEHLWSDSESESIRHNLDEIKEVFTGSTQRDTLSGYDYTTGSGNLSALYQHVFKGELETGEHSLKSILQELITKSHFHQVERNLYNCNCNCNCGGNN